MQAGEFSDEDFLRTLSASGARAPVSPYDDVLPAEEFERRLAVALESVKGPEGQQMAELIAWFLRRYPRPLDRLRYARRKFEEARRMKAALPPGGASLALEAPPTVTGTRPPRA